MKILPLFSLALCLAASVSAQTFVATFLNKVKTASEAIKASKLAPAIQTDFQNRLTKIQDKACAATASGSAASVAGKACNATPEKIEEATDALSALSDDLAAAVTADGSKGLPQLYAPKLAALTAELNAAKLPVDAADRKPLDKRIADFPNLLKSGNPGLVTGKPKQDIVTAADEQFNKLKDDVDAAVALAADKSNSVGFFTAFQAKVKKLQTAIGASKLDKAIQMDFSTKLGAINDSVCSGTAVSKLSIGFTADGLKKACPQATASAVEAADGKVDDLTAALTQAIADDGTKSLGALYAPKIKALQVVLAAAKIPDNDRKNLTGRITAFQESLSTAKQASAVSMAARTHGDPVQDAADTYQKLSDDVNAAVALSKDKDEAGGFVKGFETKVGALQKKIAGSRLNAAFQQDFTAKLNAIVTATCGSPMSAQAVTCAKYTPSKLEAADGQLATLSDSVDDAIKNLGTETLTILYKDKIAALDTELNTGGINSTDLRALQGRLQSFKNLLTSKAGPGVDLVAKASDTYDALKADADAAVALSKTPNKKN
jgi:hypothetical protein